MREAHASRSPDAARSPILAVVPRGTLRYYSGMGIYDRDYAQEPEPGYHFGGPQTLTTQLVLVTAGVYLAQLFLGADLTRFLSLNSDWWRHPWEAFRLLTYGFLHSPNAVQHIVFNMFGLWMFGRDVEARYGRRQFLAFYLTAIIFAGVVWSIVGGLNAPRQLLLGASGGTTAVIILYCLNFPHRTLLLHFFIPVPAWVVGIIVILGVLGGSFAGSSADSEMEVAFVAHLAGAGFAFFYFRTRWNPLESVLGLAGGFSLPKRSKLRVHQPEEADENEEAEVDRILRKISASGQDSLTWKERRTLQRASQEFKNRRH
jgi:membrane associated rhomboid family serine protease